MDGSLVCTVASVGIAACLIIYGFILVLRKSSHESPTQTISAQLRGFAFVLLAFYIFILGMGVCKLIFGGKITFSYGPLSF